MVASSLPGAAAEAELDTPGMEGGERSELLGDGQRRMVGEHDAARAEEDPVGVGGDVGDQDCGRR